MKKKLMALLLCLTMIISMVAGLTACNQEEKNVEDELVSKDDGAKTITLWIVTENEKTATDEDGNPCFSEDVQEAMDDVEEALSEITKSKYQTRVDIRYFTEDEYFDKLDQVMTANTRIDELVDEVKRALSYYKQKMKAEMKKENSRVPYMNDEELEEQFYIDYANEPFEYYLYKEENVNKETTNVTSAEEYFINDLGMRELKYPEAGENQVDIIYMSGMDMLEEYIENQWLFALDEDLKGVGSLITKDVSPALIQGIKKGGVTYAIPNNIAIGEYTYMLIDKKMYDAFGNKENFSAANGLADYEEFLSDVANNVNVEGDECYGSKLIASTFEETMAHYAWYWNIESETVYNSMLGVDETKFTIGSSTKFSMFGALYGDAASAGRGSIQLGYNNLMENAEYVELLKTLKSYEVSGYYDGAEAAAEEKVAIKYVNGDYTIKKTAEANDNVYKDENGREYYVSIAKYPEVGNDELYGNMFAISATSVNTYACVEVLTALNTNSEVRNILQYGVNDADITKAERREGKQGHYTIDNDGVLHRMTLGEGEEYYSMDIKKTGNCFKAHPEEGLPENHWEGYMDQNGDAVVNPLLGFDFNAQLSAMGMTFNEQELSNVDKVSDIAWKIIDNAQNVEELNLAIDRVQELFSVTNLTITNDNGDENDDEGEFYITVAIVNFTNSAYENGTYTLPYTVYYSWMSENGYLPN